MSLRELPSLFSAPILGDTFAFIGDPAGFLQERANELGNVFKIKFLGEDVACFVGPDAFHFFLDETFFARDGASPPPVQAMLHEKAVPFLDGDTHRTRKALLMQAFSDDALATYSRIAERVMRRYVRRWAEVGAFHWVPELSSLAMTVASALFVGADPDRDHPDLEEGFLSAFGGMLSIPINLPFTQYGKALKDRDFLRERIAEAVADHRKNPRDDAMGRLCAAKTTKGETLSDELVRIESFHFFGAYVLVIASLAFQAMFLGLDPEVKERLRAEIKEKMPDGPITYARMRELTYLERVTKEVRRARAATPVTVFARAKKDCSFGGIHIPEGMKAIGAIGPSLQNDKVYAEPSKFDPDRWGGRAGEQQEKGWVPHGGGVHLEGHRCAGERLAELMMKMFAVITLRDFDWSFPTGQDFTSTTGQLFATPKGGLDVRFTRLRVK